MATQIWASVMGVLGIGANAIIYQQKTGSRLLLWKLISDIFWALHYFILGAYSGAAIACVGIVRESIFMNKRHAWARSQLWLLLFAALSVTSTALTWKSAMNIFPGLAALISVFGFRMAIPRLSRFLALPISACMLTYNIYVLSYVGIVSEILVIISAIFALVKAEAEIRKKKNER